MAEKEIRTCEEYVLQELQNEKEKVSTLGAALDRKKIELDECCDSYEAQVRERDKKIKTLERLLRVFLNSGYSCVRTATGVIHLMLSEKNVDKETYQFILETIKEYDPDFKEKFE